MSYIKHTEKALNLIRGLPRISLGNIRDNPGSKKQNKRGRGQHGGNSHGCGSKGSGQRQNYMRLGYETGNFPFYRRPPKEYYYRADYMRRQYQPIRMDNLQRFIDTNRLDTSRPIDIAQLCNLGVIRLEPFNRQYGFQLKDEGVDKFKAKIHIEVQHASELVISTIERNGGIIRTAYYDPMSLFAMENAEKFFRMGKPIPSRTIPPDDAIEYYSDPKNRGYLADPEAINRERLVLAQKYGYELPRIEDDPQYEMFSEVKDPRQIFYGLEPGWLINLVDKTIMHAVSEPTTTDGRPRQSVTA